MLFQLNGTLVVFVVSFLIYMWLLNEIMLKPVGRVMAERQKFIEKEIEAGRGGHLEAGKLQTQYEDDLKKIRGEAQAVIAKTTDEANGHRTEELGKIAKAGQAKVEQAKQDIDAERAQLIDALVAEERELVETITRKVLGDESVQVSIDAGEVRRTLEEAC
jgi:F-type H+-transporting ATPase subunit b